MVTDVLRLAEVTTPVFLCALIYIERASTVMVITESVGDCWPFERVFMGALVTASKYLNDCAMKNCHWSPCTGRFGNRDIGRMEREFLAVLDWNLLSDVVPNYLPVLIPVPVQTHVAIFAS